MLYRVHDSNNLSHVLQNLVHEQWLRRSNLVGVYADHFGLRSDLARRTDVEFRSIENPSLQQYRAYRSIIWSLKLPLWERLKMLMRIYLWFKGRKDVSLRSLVGLPPKTSA